MKKLTLLFTVLCIGQLYGMNEEPKWGNLPHEVKSLIIMALSQSGNDLNTAVNNLKTASAINTPLKKMIGIEYSDLESFTKLVHIFADKFNTSTEDVAASFGTPTAHKYIELGRNFFDAVSFNVWPEPVNNIDRLIKQGADINFTTYFATRGDRINNKDKRHLYWFQLLTPLEVVVNNLVEGKERNSDKLDYLLEHGIDPAIINKLYDKTLSDIKRQGGNFTFGQLALKGKLEEAMKKQEK